MSELEKTAYDRGFYNGIREARQIFAKHLNVSTSTDEIKWDNVSKNEILSEIDNFMTKNEAYPQPQLTIPKDIADILDNVFNSFTKLQNNANSLMIQTIYTHYEPETTFYKWFNTEDNSYNISIIYLAGKALGVDLVKVVEG